MGLFSCFGILSPLGAVVDLIKGKADSAMRCSGKVELAMSGIVPRPQAEMEERLGSGLRPSGDHQPAVPLILLLRPPGQLDVQTTELLPVSVVALLGQTRFLSGCGNALALALAGPPLAAAS